MLTPDLGRGLASLIAAALLLEGVGLLAHLRDLRGQGEEGDASFYEQTTTYGYPY